eukprot:m.702881 g.702881  ORF g.702881 m.702881 type:complete len:457 (-) comp58714_c0_seq2:2984-4354(-)
MRFKSCSNFRTSISIALMPTAKPLCWKLRAAGRSKPSRCWPKTAPMSTLEEISSARRYFAVRAEIALVLGSSTAHFPLLFHFQHWFPSILCGPFRCCQLTADPWWRSATVRHGRSHAGGCQALPSLHCSGFPWQLSTILMQIAANDATKLVLANWKLEETDRLLAQISKVKDAKRAKEAALRLQATQSIEKQIEEAARMDTVRQTELKRSYLEYEKRISEHDRTVRKNLEERLVSLTLQMVKDAELELEKAKIAAQEARDALQQAKMKLREQHELENKERNPGESSRPKCNFRELDDVVMRDVGDKLAAQPAWPMLIDFSRQVSTFLRYRDTNYINACSPHDTEPERIRMAILGALRFGKALVIDLMDVELWNTLPLIFNAVQPRLFEDIVSKNLVKKQTFKTLLKAKDGEEYKPANFSDARIGKFRTIFITTQRFPDADMLAATYALEVLPSPPV